jgi:predicted GH43/DUF377 family glycosyl hydrolase
MQLMSGIWIDMKCGTKGKNVKMKQENLIFYRGVEKNMFLQESGQVRSCGYLTPRASGF